MLKNKLTNYSLILASGSPRRQQFLKDLDLDFEIRLKDVEEFYPDTLQGIEITAYLAKLKADAFEGEIKENQIVVTSDTLVWHNGKALGKPKDREHAIAILTALSGTTHEVFTSVCFKTKSKTDLISETTKVSFNSLPLDHIHYYIDKYQPYDKAGAYGIQEWIGLVGVSKIEGSYTNVMGLPTEAVYNYLNRLTL